MLAIVMAVSILGMSTVEPAEAAPIVIYVSPNGNDATSGIWTGRPVRTPQRARELVRALTPAMNRDIVVSLADGTYPMTSPLALDVRDSGNNGHNVVWKAAPGARPVLSGGVRITGWTRSGDMWSAPVPPGLRTRQFYVNGVRAQRASGPLPVKVKTISKGYETDTPVMDNWRNPKDIEFVYREGLGGWTVPRCPVAAISPTQITMAQPCWDNTDKRLPRTSSQAWNLVGRPKLHVTPTAVENAFELLDSPGEWYLDSALNKVFYRPRPGEDLLTANVVVPVLESLLSVTGTASDPVHNVVFDGLQFSYATWLQPSTPDGFSEVQATYTLTGAGAGDSQGLCSLVPGGVVPTAHGAKPPVAYGCPTSGMWPSPARSSPTLAAPASTSAEVPSEPCCGAMCSRISPATACNWAKWTIQELGPPSALRTTGSRTTTCTVCRLSSTAVSRSTWRTPRTPRSPTTS
ncbi:hypothetical protein GCM10029964_086900 [Kibdelosporangium lantanae]